jgi:YbbR domain-containing protein
VFSVAAAFALWVVIQDVDNPRAEGVAPAAGGIAVEAVNVPEGFLVADLPSVTVRVEAREDDLASLRAGDFRAEVDISEVPVNPGTGLVRIRVESRRKGVEVLSVVPSSIEVTLQRAADREVRVVARVTGSPPEGFRVKRDPLDDSDVPPTLDPATVTVRGRSDLVDQVEAVELVVSLAEARDDTVVLEGELTARGRGGSALLVALSTPRGRATFRMERVFVTRSVGLLPIVTGTPAPGYTIAQVVVDPVAVQVTGPRAVVEGLRGPLTVERVDISGARQAVTANRNIERPPNVVTERTSVTVRVEIVPVDCGSGVGSPCEGITLVVAVTAEQVPLGLVLEQQILVAQVRVSGPLAQIASLRPTDLRAVVSLAGAVAGPGSYVPRVTAPAGIRIETVEAVTVTLRAVTAP